MRYKSITTLLHDPNRQAAALDCAIQAARNWDAHLHVLCTGIDATDPGFYYAGAQAIAVQQNLECAQHVASELEEKLRNRLAVEDIRWDVETVTMMAQGLNSFVSDHMRFHDIAILPLPYSEQANQLDVAAFEACLFGADIPIIVVPDGAQLPHPISRLVIAWDDGAEALSAARAAIDLASTAGVTEISVIDPPPHGADRSDPGGRLAQLLSRSGASVEVSVTARTQTDVATQLLQRAHEKGADMIVMGAYGHSRLREAVLGGATRSMLRQATLPILMAR